MIKYFTKFSFYIFISILFSILLINSLSKHNFTGEFFLNYTSGFIRRGFIGSLIYLLDYLIKINPQKLASITNIISKLSLFFLLIYYAVKLKIPKILIFSYPIFFTGLINSNGRLDFILLLVFICSLIILKSNIKFKILLYSILTIIGLLLHEVYYFIIIIPTIFILLITKQKYFITYFLLTTILFLFLSTYFRGETFQVQHIEKNWLLLDYKPNFSYVYRDLVSNSTFYIYQYIKTKTQIIGFLFNNLMCVTFIIISAISKDNRNQNIIFTSLILFQNLVFLFLCFFACDYSRWYFILFTSVIYFYYYFKKEIELLFKNFSLINFDINWNIITFSKYLLYFFISIPFAGWSFNQYYNSHLYFVIKKILNLI